MSSRTTAGESFELNGLTFVRSIQGCFPCFPGVPFSVPAKGETCLPDQATETRVTLELNSELVWQPHLAGSVRLKSPAWKRQSRQLSGCLALLVEQSPPS